MVAAPAAGPAAPRVVVPTVVVGLGATGEAIVRAVADEGAVRGGAHEHARFIYWRPGDGGRAPGDDPDDALAAGFDRALSELLGLGHAVRASRTLGGHVPLDVLIVGHIGPDDLRPRDVAAALAALDRGAGPHAALLKSREAGRRAFASPILLLPSMDDPRPGTLGGDVAALLASWADRWAPGCPDALPFARCWLVEPRTSHHGLDGASRERMVRAFLRFLLYGSLRTDADRYQRIFEPREDPDPFGSFLVGAAEVPAGLLRELAAVDAGLTAMRALEQPTRVALGPELAGYREDAWLNGLLADLPGPDREREIDGLIARQVPRLGGELGQTRLLERPGRVRDRFGLSWLDGTTRALSEATGAGGPDSVAGDALEAVVHDMARVGTQRVEELSGALGAELDGWLAEDTAAHHLDAQAFLAEVERGVAARRATEEAAAAAEPDPGPDAERLEAAVTQLHADVERKVDPLLGLGLGALGTALVVVLGAGLIPMIAGVFERPGEARPAWLEVLREAPGYWIVAVVLAVGGVGGVLLYRLWAQTRAINRRLGGESAGPDALASVLGELESGPRGSVRAYHRTRYELTRAHWRARALAALGREVAARRARLEQARQAVRAQLRALEARRVALSDRLEGEAGDFPLGRLVVSGATIAAMAREVADAFVGGGAVRRVKAVLRPFAAAQRGVPFADLEPLLAEVRRKAGTTTLFEVLTSPELGAEASRRVWELIDEVQSLRRQGGGVAAGTRLHLPLQTSALHEDPNGVAGLDRPRLFATDKVISHLTSGEGAHGHRGELLREAKRFFDPDRLYVLQVAWGIHPSVIPWLAPSWPAAQPGDNNVVPLDRRRTEGEG